MHPYRSAVLGLPDSEPLHLIFSFPDDADAQHSNYHSKLKNKNEKARLTTETRSSLQDLEPALINIKVHHFLVCSPRLHGNQLL